MKALRSYSLNQIKSYKILGRQFDSGSINLVMMMAKFWCSIVLMTCLGLSIDPIKAQDLNTALFDRDASTLQSKCEDTSLSRVQLQKESKRWELTTDSLGLMERYRGYKLTQFDLNCQLQQCQDPIAKSEILRALQIPIYQAITKKNIIAMWTRLMAIGLFEQDSFLLINPKPKLSKLTRELQVVICALSPPIIESIQVRYQSSAFYPKQFLSEIYKRLNLKRGGYLPKQASYLRELESQLVASYKRLGYRGVTVQLIPVYPDNNRQRVILEIRIKEGSRPLLGSPVVEILDTDLDQESIQESTLRIARSITPDLFYDTFRDFFSLFGIGHYDRRAARQRADQLEEDLRSEGWVSARVKVIGDELYNGKMSPIISIRRGPKLNSRFQGNLALRSEDLEKELTFKNSGVIDEVELEASRQNLLKRYKSASYYYVDIKAEIKVRNPELSEAIFVIDEGPQVYVGKSSLEACQLSYKKRLIKALTPRGSQQIE